MSTIRERDAAFAKLAAEHPATALLCAAVAEDRRALLAALDALVAVAQASVESGQPPVGWSARTRADVALRAAIAKTREVTG